MKRAIFNPEHDLCMADGSGSFIPPAAVVEFARRCSWVERFMVGTEGEEPPVEIVPWGWDRCLRERLLKEGVPAEQLPDDAQLDFIREHSRRELAVELLERVRSYTGEDYASKLGNSVQPSSEISGSIVSPAYRIVAHTMEEIETFLQERVRVVLKAPLSGSGKGVRFATGELMATDRGWCRRTLQRQGAVIVEQRMELVKEFAMLFEFGETVNFRGYSLFYATNGAYKGNLLASNEYIEKVLGEFVPVVELRQVQERIREFLQEKLQGRYRGFVGVDQFVAVNDHAAEVAGADEPENLSGRKFCWNPAMEINLRMTMGLVARNIYDYHAAEYGLGEGTHCFEPEKGIFKCG